MYDLIKSNSQAKALQDLNTAWQTLIRERAAARSGTQARNRLDNFYFKLLPTIVAIQDAVNDDEISRLVHLAMSQLKKERLLNEANRS